MQAKDHLLHQFDSLSPTLQTAARFLIDRPNEVVIASMRALAERAQVQPATLVRLAQHIGYAGWPELKEAFARDLGLHAERYGQKAKALAARGNDAGLVGEMFDAHRANLDATENACVASLRHAAALLRRAPAIYVAGFRASYPVAHALTYGYRLFRDSVHLVDGMGGGLEMQLRPIQKQDCLVAISFAPYSREALTAIEAAQAAGAKIIAFTDSEASPLGLAADVTVLFSARSPSFFPSVVAAVAAVEALLEILVAEAGDSVVSLLEGAEQQLFDSGAYLKASGKRAR